MVTMYTSSTVQFVPGVHAFQLCRFGDLEFAPAEHSGDEVAVRVPLSGELVLEFLHQARDQVADP